MTTQKSRRSHRSTMRDELQAQLQTLCSEDNFAGGLSIVDDYPELRTREISRFEHDMRDWGFIYGVAFGLAISTRPEMAHEAAAELAYWPARQVFACWSGEIHDPGEKRESAIRTLVEQYERADTRTSDLGPIHDAIADLVESARA